MPDRMSLAEFRSEYNGYIERQKARGCSYDELRSCLEGWLDIKWSRLPDFPVEMKTIEIDKKPNWFTDEDSRCFSYNGYYYTSLAGIAPSSSNIIEEYITPYQAIGQTWLFVNDRTYDRPCTDRLSSLLLGVPESITPFFVEKAGNYYYCSDGNHRLYAAYLLDRRVKVQYYEEYTKVYDSAGTLIS